MRKVVLVLSIALIGNRAPAAPPKVEFIQGDNKIDVVIAGKPFTSYLYGDDCMKACLMVR